MQKEHDHQRTSSVIRVMKDIRTSLTFKRVLAMPLPALPPAVLFGGMLVDLV